MPLCPTCHNPLPPTTPATEKFHPFCSRRCADVDLHRWFGEIYTLPTTEEPDNSEELKGPNMVF